MKNKKLGIADNLLQFAKDEGVEAALERITEWNKTIEEIAEISVIGHEQTLAGVKDALDYCVGKLRKQRK